MGKYGILPAYLTTLDNIKLLKDGATSSICQICCDRSGSDFFRTAEKLRQHLKEHDNV